MIISSLPYFGGKHYAYHKTSLLSFLKSYCTEISFKKLAHTDMRNLNQRLKFASLLS